MTAPHERHRDGPDRSAPGSAGLPLRRRTLAIAVVIGVLLVLVAVVAFLALRSQDRDLDDVRGTLVPARTEVGELQAALLDQQAALRGYVITEDPEVRGRYEVARSREADSVDVLDGLLSGRPSLSEPLDAVVRASETWATDVATPILADVDDGDTAGAAFLIDVVGDPLVEERLRPAVTELRLSIEDELADRDRALSEANDRLALVLIVAVILVGGAFIAVAVLARRWVIRPIEELDVVVRAGRSSAGLRASSPTELVRVGAEADALRRRAGLGEQAARRAREALADSAPAVRAVQTALEPSPVDFPPGLDIAGRVRPAAGVLAGDWYEFVDLGPGRTAFVVADVSGHGVIPGVVALRAKQLVPAGLRLGMDPGEFLGWMDNELGDMGELFLTAFVGIIDVSTDTCAYANAGHPAAVVIAPATRVLDPTGPLLGALKGSWQTETTVLPDPGLLVVTTDGVIDARDAKDEYFGEDRFLACFDFQSRQPTRELADSCLDAVLDFVGDELVDDATIVVARVDHDRDPDPSG